jgi:hypothetical protein
MRNVGEGLPAREGETASGQCCGEGVAGVRRVGVVVGLELDWLRAAHTIINRRAFRGVPIESPHLAVRLANRFLLVVRLFLSNSKSFFLCARMYFPLTILFPPNVFKQDDLVICNKKI